MVAVVGYGGAQVIREQVHIGELVAFNSYLMFILSQYCWWVLQPGNCPSWQLAERIYEVVDAMIEIRRPERFPSKRLQVGSLSKMHFRYPGAATEALKGISFETKPKELIAILGMTGSGKSI